MSTLGKAVPHESARGHVSGSALYADDLVPRFSGCLHAWPVQAPHAHARILRIDARDALMDPAVIRVLTAQDVPGENDVGPAVHDEPLLPNVVQYHGQGVAWVLATSEENAKLAAARVHVEYAVLDPILTLEKAAAERSYHTPDLRMARGDARAALRTAPLTASGEIATGAQEHFYLEMQAAIATSDGAGGILVHSSTQHPTETQTIVARVLGIPRHLVTCEALRMGGAFGGKEVQANAFAAIAALGAQLTSRPVSVRLDRRRDMILTGKRHPFFARYEVGFDAEGRLLALVVDITSDGGFSMDLSKPVLFRGMFHVDNCYMIPNIEVVGRVAKTNKTSHTAFRGFGGPQGMLIIEEIIDRVARATGLAPHVVRQQNFYAEGDTTHYGQVVKDAERIPRIFNELLRSADFEARSREVQLYNQAHTDKKRGLAITPVKFGISFTRSVFNQAGALVLIYQDGSVQVNHGGTEMGQGVHTKIQQIAAHELGVSSELIRIMPTRTDKIPNTSATAASTGSDLNGAAVRDACTTLRSRLAAVASRMLDSAADDVRFAEGRAFRIDQPERGVDFATVVHRAYFDRIPLFATGYYRTPNLHFDEHTGKGHPFHYFCFGAALSEVRVEGDTGEYELLRVDILHDVGTSLSPLVDLGQVEGGFVQGLGWLTREDMRWDESGCILSVNASTYKLPTLQDVPEAFHVRFLERAPEPNVIHGSKAVGEPPLMLALSVREALREAIAAFAERKPDAVLLRCPSTPEAVFFAIDALRSAACAKAS